MFEANWTCLSSGGSFRLFFQQTFAHLSQLVYGDDTKTGNFMEQNFPMNLQKKIGFIHFERLRITS